MQKQTVFKTILQCLGLIFLLSALGAYFFFATKLWEDGRKKEVCRNIKVVILDSAKNRFIDKDDIINVMEGYMGPLIGKNSSKISLSLIEELLNKKSVVKKVDASITLDGKMMVSITQRRPILRVETKNGGFYIDDSQYIFPLIENFTSYVPIVSGNIPLNLYEGYRGKATKENISWTEQIYNLAKYLDENPFWNAQIEQIYIQQNGDLLLCPRVGSQKIIFGDLQNIDEKLEKLQAFYQNVIPTEGWEKYSTINLKYKKQIVCTTKKGESIKQNVKKEENII